MDQVERGSTRWGWGIRNNMQSLYTNRTHEWSEGRTRKVKRIRDGTEIYVFLLRTLYKKRGVWNCLDRALGISCIMVPSKGNSIREGTRGAGSSRVGEPGSSRVGEQAVAE